MTLDAIFFGRILIDRVTDHTVNQVGVEVMAWVITVTTDDSNDVLQSWLITCTASTSSCR